MEETYTQCLLENMHNNKITKTIYIQSKYKIGNIVLDENTNEKWKVINKYHNTTNKESEIKERSQDYKRTRKTTDI